MRQAGQRRVLSAPLPAMGALGLERAWESPGWVSTPGLVSWEQDVVDGEAPPWVRPPGFSAGRLGNDTGSPLTSGEGGQGS